MERRGVGPIRCRGDGTRGSRGIPGKRLQRFRDEEALQRSSLLALLPIPIPSPAAVALPRAELRVRLFVLLSIAAEHGRHIRRAGVSEYWAAIVREDTLSLGAPGGDGSFGFGGFTEDEAEDDVETAEGEEEEGGYEREVVNMVRKDAGGN